MAGGNTMAVPAPRATLCRLHQSAYAVGHVLNDLAAAVWFSFMLVIFTNVQLLSKSQAGALMLIGQVADALATPVVGYLSDRTRSAWGSRRPWHLAGCVAVLLSFPGLIGPCVLGSGASDSARVVYYVVVVVVFQLGWAATQVAHMTICPELSPCFSERTQLNSLRYAFTVACNMFVTAMIWLLLAAGGKGKKEKSDNLDADDQPVFTKLAIAVCAIGLAASVWFHYGMWHLARAKGQAAGAEACAGGVDSAAVAEELLAEGGGEPPTPLKQSEERVTVGQWFRMPALYTVTVLYMCSRLLLNISQVYLPLYLQGASSALRLPKDSIAQVPLVLYLASLAATPFLRVANARLGRTMVMVLSLAVSGLASLSWLFIPVASPSAPNGPLLPVLFVSAALGWASSCAMVTSLSMAADVIGEKTSSSAIIYGFLSFTDKLSSGIAIMVVQVGNPCPNAAGAAADYGDYADPGNSTLARMPLFRAGMMRVLLASPPPPGPPSDAVVCCQASSYYRNVMAGVPGVAALVALATLGLTHELNRRRKAAATAKVNQYLLDGIEDISAPLLAEGEEEGEGDGELWAGASPPPRVPRSSLPPE